MATTYAWLWTVLAFVLTWMVFHIIKRKKEATEETEAEAEERRDGVADVIIVGAGVAGAALAYALAKDGRRVHVIERDLKEPERFMGELMQAGGRLMLANLGLEDCLEEIDAQAAKSLAIYKDGKHATLPFPDDKKFPYEPVGSLFRNGRLVQRLRKKAASLTNVQLEEGTVKSLIEEKGVVKGVTYKNSAGEETTAFALLTVVCDGCYSNLRRSVVDNKEDVHSYMVGYVTKNSRLEDPHSLHLIFSKPLVCFIYQITSEEVRCVAEVPADSIPSIANGEMSNFLRNTMAPQIPENGNLREIFLKGIEEGLPEIKSTATKSMSAKLCDKKGVIVLGDAFNMRHPVIASGMMVALSDVCILRNLLRPLPNLANTKKVSELVSNCKHAGEYLFASAGCYNGRSKRGIATRLLQLPLQWRFSNNRNDGYSRGHEPSSPYSSSSSGSHNPHLHGLLALSLSFTSSLLEPQTFWVGFANVGCTFSG
ncbi:unnamed protein product [Microthlaspi erraticum]|uniref:Squalene monooxygenase n=1 Tax=Microthlaspi erraticum TaxID=1685480 RepID=A0A6D2I6M1_9BRAS|nr:unnamed protein product [Microthlaspi erraticum]